MSRQTLKNMDNANENANSQTGEGEDLIGLSPDALREAVVKARQDRIDLESKNKQLFARAKKAEGFEEDYEGNWIKIIEKPAKSSKPDKKDKSEGLDWGMKGYLRAEGFDSSEFSYIEEQMEESGIKDVEKLIKNPYFQQALKTRREQKAVEGAVPQGAGRTSGENPKSQVDYYINKGTMPEDTPENRQLRLDVLNKRIEIEQNSNRFSKQSVVYGGSPFG